MAILLSFAAFSSIRFDQILTLLLLMSTMLSAVLATLKREEPLASTLNHWDEAVAYVARRSRTGLSEAPAPYAAAMRSQASFHRIHTRRRRYWRHEFSA